MAIQFVGASAEQVARLGQLALAGIQKFGFDGDITFSLEPPADEPAEAYAGATTELIWLRPDFVESADNAHLKAVVFEEIAHYDLGLRGVPHHITPGRLIQEAFAHWFWRTRTKNQWKPPNQHLPLAVFSSNWELAYAVGFYIGAAQAGDQHARQYLNAWFKLERAEAIVDPERRFIVTAASALLGMSFSSANPVALSLRLAAFYEKKVLPHLL